MKTAKVFFNGQSQAVRIPKEFRLKGPEVFIKRQGETLILIPMKGNFWEPFFKSLAAFSEDFMSERAQPTQQTREDLFE